jgi:hypothetical protein
MAQLTDGDWTDLSEVNDIVPTERIMEYVEYFNLPLNIGNLIASVVPGRGFVPHQFARWDEPTLPDPLRAAGAGAPTDIVLYMDFSTSSTSITPVLKGIGFKIPDELLSSTVLGGGVPANLLDIAMRKIMEYRDLDVLDSVQAATNTVGTAATVPSFAQFRAYKNAFKLLENEGTPIFVANAYFWDLLEGEFTTGQSQFMARISEQLYTTGAKSAYRGTLMGFDMWESHNIATEGGGANNFMMTVGGGANRVIGQVQERAIRVEVTRGDTSTERLLNQVVVSWADATALLRPDGLQECLADAAA